jgi:hypothetical protein
VEAHAVLNQGCYQGYINGQKVEEFRTWNDGELLVCHESLEMRSSDDTGQDQIDRIPQVIDSGE